PPEGNPALRGGYPLANATTSQERPFATEARRVGRPARMDPSAIPVFLAGPFPVLHSANVLEREAEVQLDVGPIIGGLPTILAAPSFPRDETREGARGAPSRGDARPGVGGVPQQGEP